MGRPARGKVLHPATRGVRGAGARLGLLSSSVRSAARFGGEERRDREARPLPSLAWRATARSRPRIMKMVIRAGLVVSKMRVRTANQGRVLGSSVWRSVWTTFLP